MEKFYSLINSPLDTLLALIGAALLSILGAFVKDWLLRLFSRFSLTLKKRRIANSRIIYRQARILIADPVFLSLYSFKALKMAITWVTANILCILLTLYLQERTEAFLMDNTPKLTLLEMLKSSDPDTFAVPMYMIIVSILFLLCILSGYKSTTRSRILFKAYRVRKRQLSIDIKFP